MNELIFKNKTTGVVLLLSLVLLFSVSFVSAAQTTQSLTNGLEVEYLKFDYLKVNTAFNLSVGLYNISDGVRMTNANCTLNLIDQQGDLILNQNLTVTGGFYNLFLNAGNFSRTGEYQVNVYCANTVFGGFASYLIEVTPDGRNDISFYLVILAISAALIIFGFSIKDPAIAVLGSFGLTFVGLYSLLFGIIGVNNLSYSRTFSIIILLLGAYIGVRSSFEWVQGGDR